MTESATCTSSDDTTDSISPLEPSVCSPKVEAIVKQVHTGIRRRGSLPPTLAMDGCGGAYFLPGEDGRSWAAVFKPTDEEPGAPNNPKKEAMYEPRRGIRAGEAAVREFAAFLLDHEGFAGVPPTGLVECCHRHFGATSVSSTKNAPKRGSLQAFIKHDFDASEIGAQLFPVAEVHKVGILDIRLCNCDRHGGNILVAKEDTTNGTIEPTNSRQRVMGPSAEATSSSSSTSSKLRLIPIDHGFCLPDRLDEIWFEWLNWPQATVPFDKATKRYIASLDAEKDIRLLEQHGLLTNSPDCRGVYGELVIRAECLRVLKISTLFLKKCAKRGLTLFQIGRMMCRDGDLSQPSTLEQMVATAEQKVSNRLERHSRLWEEAFFKQLDWAIAKAAKHPPHVVGTRRHSV